ncbi:MAG: prolyl oligopeptidase family serine peptidase [Bacteroidota bacterium]
MKIVVKIIMVLLIFSGCNELSDQGSKANLNTSPEIVYPETNKVDHADDYFGTKVNDPYRWLEDDNSEETAAWVTEQNNVTYDYLENIPYREAIKERLTSVWNYERYSAPFRKNGKYYFFKNDGLQNQSVFYEQENLEANPSVLLDPNTFSEDGTSSLAMYSFSKDGKYLAYGIAERGSDWRTGHIMRLDKKGTMTDRVEWMKFTSFSWYKDGFFYSRYNAPEEGSEYSQKNEFHQVYYHKVGTDQSEDELIFIDRNHPERNFYAYTTEDERYLVLYGSESTSGNALFIRDLDSKETSFTPVIENFDNDSYVIQNFGSKLLIQTNIDAPNMRLVTVDASNPEPENWKDLIPETENVLESVTVADGKIIAKYIKDVKSYVRIFDLEGKHLYDLDLPGVGNVTAIKGSKEDSEAFFTFTSFTFPSTIYKWDVAGGEYDIFKSSQVDFNPEDYESRQVFYTSSDGTKVPMFITHKKGLEMDGNNPTYLYGYGGFNISLKPGFKISNIVLLENGGIYAVANIRGGGEYGEKWHKAGTKLQKQNVFNDFIAAAEYLIDNKYTSKEKLAISGGSNGGLLVGACMTQRPDLFKVAFPAVGVLDMLRYHKFTIGWAWETDYGSSDDSTQFNNLLSYSPLHNIKEGTAYPATMVTTADHDDRVVPAHSFKFISELQSKHDGPNPVLIRIETSAGHGAGKSTEQRINEIADKLSFFFYNTNEDVKYLND